MVSRFEFLQGVFFEVVKKMVNAVVNRTESNWRVSSLLPYSTLLPFFPSRFFQGEELRLFHVGSGLRLGLRAWSRCDCDAMEPSCYKHGTRNKRRSSNKHVEDSKIINFLLPRPPFACNLGGFLHPRHFFVAQFLTSNQSSLWLCHRLHFAGLIHEVDFWDKTTALQKELEAPIYFLYGVVCPFNFNCHWPGCLGFWLWWFRGIFSEKYSPLSMQTIVWLDQNGSDWKRATFRVRRYVPTYIYHRLRAYCTHT